MLLLCQSHQSILSRSAVLVTLLALILLLGGHQPGTLPSPVQLTEAKKKRERKEKPPATEEQKKAARDCLHGLGCENVDPDYFVRDNGWLRDPEHEEIDDEMLREILKRNNERAQRFIVDPEDDDLEGAPGFLENIKDSIMDEVGEVVRKVRQLRKSWYNLYSVEKSFQEWNRERAAERRINAEEAKAVAALAAAEAAAEAADDSG